MKKEAVEIKSLTNGWAHIWQKLPKPLGHRENILDKIIHYTLGKASADMGMPFWKSWSTERLSGEGAELAE